MTPFNFHSTAEEVTANLDLTGQTFLITGVNSGLGKESARVLGMRGQTSSPAPAQWTRRKVRWMNTT